jgi:hypothetical protein
MARSVTGKKGLENYFSYCAQQKNSSEMQRLSKSNSKIY